MKIEPVSHKSIPELIAGGIARSIIDGRYKAGEQLQPERALIKELEVSRSSLREALTILAEAGLIEAQQGVGWFVCELNASNQIKAYKLAAADDSTPAPRRPALDASDINPPTGPRRLPPAKEKPLRVPNLRKDRLGTFDFISWWERDKMQNARVMVVGAGALGNEVVKNLALMGVGHIFIVDFDTIETANLSRSILFREQDGGKQKAQLVAARAKEINPDVKIQYFHGDVTHALGLGIFRRIDVVIGCLDNREARLAVNRHAFNMNKPWVDGAIQELLGLVRVFVPGEGACFECTLTDQARRDLAVRYSCPLLARQNILLGKVPTTPTIASIIGAMQSQEALKLIHKMPVGAGQVTHFNGLNNHMHTTSYVEDEFCESHWVYGEITELPLRAEAATLRDLLEVAKADLGPDAIIELDQELVISLECSVCKITENIMQPISQVSFESAHCPNCGEMREVEMEHAVTSDVSYLDRTLMSVGVPPLHILRANNGLEYRFYELTGDLPTALHFSDYQHNPEERDNGNSGRIRLGKVLIRDKKETLDTLRIRLKN
jgi:adenylyltransferase/sulfurtransferase